MEGTVSSHLLPKPLAPQLPTAHLQIFTEAWNPALTSSALNYSEHPSCVPFHLNSLGASSRRTPAVSFVSCLVHFVMWLTLDTWEEYRSLVRNIIAN